MSVSKYPGAMQFTLIPCEDQVTASGGEAAGRVFLQALQAERVEVGGDLAVGVAGAARFLDRILSSNSSRWSSNTLSVVP